MICGAFGVTTRYHAFGDSYVHYQMLGDLYRDCLPGGNLALLLLMPPLFTIWLEIPGMLFYMIW